jgi:phage protein U
VASNGIATVKPLVPGQEVVGGSEGTSFLSQGPGNYDSQQVLDTRSIIQFQSEKRVKWDRLGSMYDSVAISGMTAPLDDTSSTCYQGVNATATNEYAMQFASTIGGSGEYHGLNVVNQLDSDIPDTLDTTMALQGKGGSGTIGFSSVSLIGFANTTQPMWKNSVDQRITGGGTTYSIGKQTKWRSFLNIFNSTFEGQTIPAT